MDSSYNARTNVSVIRATFETSREGGREGERERERDLRDYFLLVCKLRKAINLFYSKGECTKGGSKV